MNFDLSRLNPVYTSKTPCVGNVYAAQGGKKDGTRFWIVMAIRGDGCVLLGINNAGEIISTQSYYTSVMARKPLIGWCPGVMDLNLEIEGIPRMNDSELEELIYRAVRRALTEIFCTGGISAAIGAAISSAYLYWSRG